MDDVVSFLPASSQERAAIYITHTDRAALLNEIAVHLAGGCGFTLATLNLDHIVKLRRDPAFFAAYAMQSHVVADGNPIVWLSRLAGRKIDLIPGSELVAPLAALATQAGVPIALVGSTNEALDAAARALQLANPGLSIVVSIAPSFGFDPDGPEAAELIATLGASKARLCFLALGAPRQERFAARAAIDLSACGFVSVGAGLDFLAGTQARAPGWIRALAMEWAWRLASAPHRMVGRYAACFKILPSLTASALKARRAR